MLFYKEFTMTINTVVTPIYDEPVLRSVEAIWKGCICFKDSNYANPHGGAFILREFNLSMPLPIGSEIELGPEDLFNFRVTRVYTNYRHPQTIFMELGCIGNECLPILNDLLAKEGESPTGELGSIFSTEETAARVREALAH